jgi:isocitrate lyase
MGGKVLVPTQEAIAKLTAARLAADVCGVPITYHPVPDIA